MVSDDKVGVFVRTLAARIESREGTVMDLSPTEYGGVCFGVLAATDAFLAANTSVDAAEVMRAVLALLDDYDRERVEGSVFQ